MIILKVKVKVDQYSKSSVGFQARFLSLGSQRQRW